MMGKRKLNTQNRKTNRNMKMMVMLATWHTKRPNQEHVFLFKVVPVLAFSIPLTSKMPRAIIIRCLAVIWDRCSIWNRDKKECCPMYCNRVEMPACHYMYAVRFAKRSLNKRVRFYSTVASILSQGHIRAPNAANASVRYIFRLQTKQIKQRESSLLLFIWEVSTSVHFMAPS